MSSEGNVSLDQSRTQEKVSAVQFPCHKTKKIPGVSGSVRQLYTETVFLKRVWQRESRTPTAEKYNQTAYWQKVFLPAVTLAAKTS